MANREILVSILMITYGHENYLREAIDSVIMQDVNFKYELLIGEDDSPDNSVAILKEYEEKFPDKIKVFYNRPNLGARANMSMLAGKAVGKYIAILEGDDFWISNKKLQIAVDFLEKNLNYSAFYHNIKTVDGNGQDKTFSNLENLYTIWDMKGNDYNFGPVDLRMPSHTGSIVYRQSPLMKKFFSEIVTDASYFGVELDVFYVFIFISEGKVYCFKDILSVYRYVPDHGFSFTAMSKEKRTHELKIANAFMDLFNFLSENGASREILLCVSTRISMAMYIAFLNKEISIVRFIKYFFTSYGKLRILKVFVVRVFFRNNTRYA